MPTCTKLLTSTEQSWAFHLSHLEHTEASISINACMNAYVGVHMCCAVTICGADMFVCAATTCVKAIGCVRRMCSRIWACMGVT